MTRRVAAVDCGTNSLRLLLADVDPGRTGLTDVVRRMEIVRLGQGVDQTGRLAPEALARTMTVLRDYADVIARAGAQAVRMVATSATRDVGMQTRRDTAELTLALPGRGVRSSVLRLPGATDPLSSPVRVLAAGRAGLRRERARCAAWSSGSARRESCGEPASRHWPRSGC